MLDGGLFDKLEQLARKVRRNDAPFGGLQLVLCGDFFQLPPVGLGQDPSLKFLFEAEAWPRVVRRTVSLLPALDPLSLPLALSALPRSHPHPHTLTLHPRPHPRRSPSATRSWRRASWR